MEENIVKMAIIWFNIYNLAKFCVLCKTAHCQYASAIDTYL